MSTPQGMLHDIHHKVNDLVKSFHGDSDEDDLFEKVNAIKLENSQIIKRLDNLECTLALIVKILTQHKTNE